MHSNQPFLHIAKNPGKRKIEMNKNYQKGYAFEQRCKKFLEKKGFQVIRSPASRSSYDLMAVDDFNKLFVQCKKTSGKTINVKGMKEVKKDAELVNGIALLVYGFQRTPIYSTVITKDHYIMKEKENHVKLGDFVEIL